MARRFNGSGLGYGWLREDVSKLGMKQDVGRRGVHGEAGLESDRDSIVTRM